MDGSLSQGLGSIFGGTTIDDPHASRKNVGNRSTKLNVNLAENVIVGDRLSFLFRVAGQVSDKSLLVSDQFSLGGVDSIRGFTRGESVGDNGIVVNSEMNTPLYDEGRLIGAVFLDHGISFLRVAEPGQSSKTTLTSAGVGLRAVWNQWAQWARSFSGRLDLGIPLSPVENADKRKAVVTVSIVMRF